MTSNDPGDSLGGAYRPCERWLSRTHALEPMTYSHDGFSFGKYTCFLSSWNIIYPARMMRYVCMQSFSLIITESASMWVLSITCSLNVQRVNREQQLFWLSGLLLWPSGATGPLAVLWNCLQSLKIGIISSLFILYTVFGKFLQGTYVRKLNT